MGRGQSLLPLHAADLVIVRGAWRFLVRKYADVRGALLFQDRDGHRMWLEGTTTKNAKGQALVEFALVFPIFLMLLMAIIVFGLYVFYNQQLTNAVREAARYASVHSASAQCPTVSRLDP